MIPRRFKRQIKRILRPVPRCYGRSFKHWRELLEQSQWWDENALLEYQDRELCRLIKHCYENVPYYREVFNERGIKPADIQGRRDLVRLPCLTKADILKNFDRLRATNISPEETEIHTSGGTTGTPIAVVIEREAEALRLACEWRFYNWGGYHFNDRIAILRGTDVEGFERGRRWEFDPSRNALVLSSFDMSDKNLEIYFQKLCEFRPQFIRGYPSALLLMARFALERNLRLPQQGFVKALFTSSETVYPFERRLTEEAFGAPIYDAYGNTEQAGRMAQCNCLEGHHDAGEFAVVELLNTDASGLGEIVATPLGSYAMPLIRYRTGDLARFSETRCRCGRGLKVASKIEGRMQDIALLKDGTPLSLTAFFFAVHVPEMAQIRKIQFQQEEVGRLRVLAVKGANYQEGACELMLQRMNKNLASQFQLEIQYVDDIPQTKAGKHRFFVTSLQNGY
jgi:phenylacetate-CoA ligase